MPNCKNEALVKQESVIMTQHKKEVQPAYKTKTRIYMQQKVRASVDAADIVEQSDTTPHGSKVGYIMRAQKLRDESSTNGSKLTQKQGYPQPSGKPFVPHNVVRDAPSKQTQMTEFTVPADVIQSIETEANCDTERSESSQSTQLDGKD
jgi:hypothetical protein